MISRFFIITFVYLLGFSTAINALTKENNKEKKIASQITITIKQILADEKAYKKLDKIILKANNKINQKQTLINQTKNKKALLDRELKNLNDVQKSVESKIIALTIKRYSKSIAIKYANKKSKKSIIDNEVYVLLFNSIKEEVSKYNEISKVLISKISSEQKIVSRLNTMRKEQENLIVNFKKLKIAQKENLKALRIKHTTYVSELENRNRNKKEINKISTDLSLTKTTSKNKSNKIQNLTPKSNKVTRVSISGYNGIKTIPPFINYTTINKFGKYYDKIYKAELFNKSISLKTTKEKTPIHAIFDGEIIFIKEDIKSVIIIKHRDGLKTIYSNLDDILSDTYVGKKLLKGSILGTINDSLNLEATYDNKYIDPEKLFK